MTKIFKKLEKNVKISIKLRFLAIGCSSVATRRGGGGALGDGEGGGGQQWGRGATVRWGGAIVGGVTSGGVFKTVRAERL